MSKKIYWNLLVLLGVLYQGIIGALSEKDVDESSELLIRQKRVINRLPGRDVKEQIENVPYIVSIKVVKPRAIPVHCVGVILTHLIVLTLAQCVKFEIGKYKVMSGVAQISIGSHPVRHSITDKRIMFNDHPLRHDGIALVKVAPPFTYSMTTRNIEIYDGLIPSGFYGTVSGWGCNPDGQAGTAHPNHLRSITLPILNTYDCAMFYLMHTLQITESDICTHDVTGNQYCGEDDAGAPLVIKVGTVNKLVGIHLWNGAGIGHKSPDVFVKLQYPKYKAWISKNIQSLES